MLTCWVKGTGTARVGTVEEKAQGKAKLDSRHLQQM